MGYYHTELDGRGNPSIEPFPHPVLAATTEILGVPLPTYTGVETIQETDAPLARRHKLRRRKSTPPDEGLDRDLVVRDVEDIGNLGPGAWYFGDLFAPISTKAPPGVFERKTTHPVPKLSIVDGDVAIQTNVC